MTIWKQGPYYPELGKKVVELPNKVDPGPSDSMIRIDGFHVCPDRDGNFIENGEMDYSEDELDAIHTFAIVRMVINMYEELLGKPIYWSWWKDRKGEPLTVKIRNNDINARFLKEQKCIELDYYGPYGNWTYNCRCVDLVAHETGHAILDSLLPLLNEGNQEAMGLGEAFCDLTAMFWILSQMDLCEDVIKATDGDLSKDSFLTVFAAGHGYPDNPYQEMRNANKVHRYKGAYLYSYNYSQVIVNRLYIYFCELLNNEQKKNIISGSLLFGLSQYFKIKVFTSFQKLKNTNLNILKSHSLLVNKLISNVKKSTFKG